MSDTSPLPPAERTATKSSAATSGFTLDTSGAVGPCDGNRFRPAFLYWPDLDAFTQGYAEAALEEFARSEFGSTPVTLRFDSLAAETLAAILKDCEFGESYSVAPWGRLYNGNAAGGGCFWLDRQAGKLSAFPPLTATLEDDGKVYLREATGEQP